MRAPVPSLLVVVGALLVTSPAIAAGKDFGAGKRITLSVHKADVQSVLRLLCDKARVNLVMGEDVKGQVTLQLRDTPLADALDVVLASNGLGSEQRGNILRVAPLKQLQDEAEAQARLKKARRDAGPLVTTLIPVNYANAKDMAPLVKESLSERGSVSVDARTNSLIVRDVAP